jgi:hypothetical protein
MGKRNGGWLRVVGMLAVEVGVWGLGSPFSGMVAVI